jgi:Lipocalin-like domain
MRGFGRLDTGLRVIGLIAAMGAEPNGAEQLVGAWKLISCVMEDVDTHEQMLPWGNKPNGLIVVTSAGRWIVVQTAQGSRPSYTDEERATAFRSMLAYSGSYRAEGQQIVINVDIAWDESWIGTEQLRTFRIEGDKLHIEAAPQRYSSFGGRTLRGVLVWQREESARIRSKIRTSRQLGNATDPP